MLIVERQLTLVCFLVFSVLLLYHIQKAQKGSLPRIRPIAAIEALEEAVGRATELGRPIHFAPGSGELSSDVQPQTMAGLQIMGYVAKLTAAYGVGLIVTVREPVVFLICQGIVKQSYLSAGKPDAYQDSMVQYLSNAQLAYTANAMGIIQRENVAANILIGPFYAESLMLAEAGFQVGAIQIAGTARMYQLPFFVAACDYTLLGEEMFTAGSFVSKDAIGLGCVAGQDIAKMASLAAIVLGALMATVGSKALPDFLNKYGR